MKHLDVVGAIIVFGGKILCMKRGAGKYPCTAYKYEFPGGKIEPGESKTAALERELREEMDIQVKIDPANWFWRVEHVYPDFSISMDTYFCYPDSPAFTMKEHVDAKWLFPSELQSLEWAPADAELIKKLAEQPLIGW